MYEVDSRDTVVELTDIPQSDTGAPLPQLLVTEGRLLLAYLLSEPDPKWDGTNVTIVSPDTSNLPIAIVDFQRPSAHIFGPPNDEAFSGHPLASRGLQPYAVFEVQNSSWIRKQERMNSVHRSHNKERFLANLRHFIFTFHDSTFECIAYGFKYHPYRGSMVEAFEHMLTLTATRSS